MHHYHLHWYEICLFNIYSFYFSCGSQIFYSVCLMFGQLEIESRLALVACLISCGVGSWVREIHVLRSDVSAVVIWHLEDALSASLFSNHEIIILFSLIFLSLTLLLSFYYFLREIMAIGFLLWVEFLLVPVNSNVFIHLVIYSPLDFFLLHLVVFWDPVPK